MSEFPTKPRDVSYLKGELPLTRFILQQFENKWFKANQLRDQGKRSTRLDLEITALAVITAIIGIPEIGLSFAREAVRYVTPSSLFP